MVFKGAFLGLAHVGVAHVTRRFTHISATLVCAYFLSACASFGPQKMSDRILPPNPPAPVHAQIKIPVKQTAVTPAAPVRQIQPASLVQKPQSRSRLAGLTADHPLYKIETALQENPGDIIALTDRGEYYAKFNYTEVAIKDFSKALEIAPDYVRALQLRAESYKEKGLKNLALADYSAAMKEQPRNANLYQSRGVYHGSLGEYDLAEADLKKALKLNPESAQYNHNMSVLLGKRSKLKQALKYANKAIALQANYGIAQHGRGIILARMGNYDAANGAFDKAIEINPKWATLYLSRGMSYEKLGMRNHAIADYNKALAMNPNLFQAKKYLGRLQTPANSGTPYGAPLRTSQNRLFRDFV